MTGLLGNEKLLDYSMTKGDIHAFVRSLATHLIDKGIRVNAVAPGPVWTPLNPADRDADGVSKFGSQTPMRRPAQPEEIAPAFVFLAAAGCSRYITTTLPVPIEADESAGSVADVYDLVTQRAVDVINLKITKLGGLRNVVAAVNICEAGGVGCRLGAAFGPALLQSFSAHVAGTFRELPFPCELSEHLHLHDDPFTDFPCENGTVTIPAEVGCGAQLAGPTPPESVAVFQ